MEELCLLKWLWHFGSFYSFFLVHWDCSAQSLHYGTCFTLQMAGQGLGKVSLCQSYLSLPFFTPHLDLSPGCQGVNKGQCKYRATARSSLKYLKYLEEEHSKVTSLVVWLPSLQYFILMMFAKRFIVYFGTWKNILHLSYWFWDSVKR